MVTTTTEPRQGRLPRGEGSAAALLAALLTFCSVPLHAWMLLTHNHGPVLTALLSAMAAWCLWCALSAVRSLNRPRPAALWHMRTMAGAMALLHLVLLTGFPGSAAHHHGGNGGTGAWAGIDTGTGLMLAIVALELAICCACTVALRAQHRATAS